MVTEGILPLATVVAEGLETGVEGGGCFDILNHTTIHQISLDFLFTGAKRAKKNAQKALERVVEKLKYAYHQYRQQPQCLHTTPILPIPSYRLYFRLIWAQIRLFRFILVGQL